MVKIGVIIPARNEEKCLGKTLDHLSSQTFKPDMIIVVDDGSSDRTAEVARNRGVSVIKLADRGYSAVGRPELAEVWNRGLRFLDGIDGFDYVMILGADQLLPKNYVQEIVKKLEKDKEIVIASGTVMGELSRAPRGSGRIYRFEFLQKIKYFPFNYGSESYPILKALTLGYKTEIFRDLQSFGQRPTKLSINKLYIHGKSLKAFGCDPLYVLWECFLRFFQSPKGALNILKGYFSSGVRKYSDLNIGEWQRRHILKRLLTKIGKLFGC